MNSIASDAKIGKDISIGRFVIVEPDCDIGDNVVIGDRVTLCRGTRIGNSTVIQEGAIIGKQPRPGPRSLHPIVEQPGAQIGEKTLIGANAIIYAGTTIGSYCVLADMVWVRERCSIGDWTVLGRGVNAEWGVTVGHHTRIVNNSQITEGTIIGNHVFVGPDVCMLVDRKMTRDNNMHRPPVLKDKCRIGGNATIMPGVVVGVEAAVGAGSVVHRSVPDGYIVAGNPARIIGKVLPEDMLKE